MTQPTVGIVGLGKMGSAFAHRFLDQSYRVAVWNRTPQPMSALANAGAIPYTSLSGLATSVDVVIVMLWGDLVARAVTLSQIIPTMRPSQMLIEMSTLSPDMYETLERAAQERQIDFVAAPVLGNPDAAREGSLNVLAGGSESPVRRAHPILASLGNVTEMPSVRASGFLKLANNSVLGVVAETLAELLRLCEEAGVDRELSVRSLAGAFQRSSQQKLPQLLAGDFEPRFSLEALLKDLQLARKAAQSLRVPLPILDSVVPDAEHAVENGLGDRDYIILANARVREIA